VWDRPEAERSSLRGKNSASPEPKRSPAALPEALRVEPSKNIFFPLIEKFFRARAKLKIVEKMFLLGLRVKQATAGWEGKGLKGKGIPAPPSLSSAAEFRASETGMPPDYSK